ncbi:uncharacterized protein IL334_001669 [Kwoniella shivajii]|uniref:Uncharacterized protein n=1 Tax=Kwoniella shivajii TaxID=564305 RepID=A0ABZ1CSK1_9TREE|nr:hypothetical protein IL334_001669 [Kwoniella shivajii]
MTSPDAVLTPLELRQTRKDSWKLHLRPLVATTYVRLPLAEEEFRYWCDICDKLIVHHELDAKPIEAFRKALFNGTTFPSVNNPSARSVANPIETADTASNCNTISNSDGQDEMDILSARIEALNGSLDVIRSSFDVLERRVTQIHSRLDKGDDKLDNLEIKVDDLNKQVKRHDEQHLMQVSFKNTEALELRVKSLEEESMSIAKLGDDMVSLEKVVQSDLELRRKDQSSLEDVSGKVEFLDQELGMLAKQSRLRAINRVSNQREFGPLPLPLLTGEIAGRPQVDWLCGGFSELRNMAEVDLNQLLFSYGFSDDFKIYDRTVDVKAAILSSFLGGPCDPDMD